MDVCFAESTVRGCCEVDQVLVVVEVIVSCNEPRKWSKGFRTHVEQVLPLQIVVCNGVDHALSVIMKM